MPDLRLCVRELSSFARQSSPAARFRALMLYSEVADTFLRQVSIHAAIA